MLTRSLLKQEVDYNFITGVMVQKNPIHKNKVIKPSKTYRTIRVLGKKYLVHRLAFLYMTGKMPKLVDHIDRNILNNAWHNLREATRSMNGLNTSAKGVYRSGKKWLAKVMIKGEVHYLGLFNTYNEAQRKYNDYKKLIRK